MQLVDVSNAFSYERVFDILKCCLKQREQS